MLERHNQREFLSIQTEEDPGEDRHHPTPVKGLVEIEIHGPRHVVNIGVALPKEQVVKLNELLINFKELFAWRSSDIPGIATDVITHELNIDPMINPEAQRKRQSVMRKVFQLGLRLESWSRQAL